jgi:hypothetical protein
VVVPFVTSRAGQQIGESAARLGAATPAERAAAEAAHTDAIRRAIGGTGGAALADVEALAMAARSGGPGGTLVADASGALTRGGAAAGSAPDLVERVARANNAARAHGLPEEYVIQARPGPQPGTTEYVVTAQPRGTAPAGVGAHLYVGVSGRAAAEARELARLRTAAGATPFRVDVLPDGTVRMNGQLEVHPGRLAEIADADLAELVRATRALDDVGGDIGRLKTVDATAEASLVRFASSGSYRLRFAYTRSQAQQHLDDLLAQLGTNRASHRAFANVTPGDADRLYDIYRASVASDVEAHLKPQAARYALDQNPATTREFVEHYEFYMAEFSARFEAAAQRHLAGTGRTKLGKAERRTVRAEVLAGLADPANPRVPAAGESAAVRAAYDTMAQHLGARHGGGRVQAGMSDAATVTAIQSMSEVQFASQSAAVYHAHKHFGELPGPEQARAPNAITAYVDSAVDTVRHADPVAAAASRSTAQAGDARSFTFTRTIDGKQMRAIVFVTREGRVILATYMSL